MLFKKRKDLNFLIIISVIFLMMIGNCIYTNNYTNIIVYADSSDVALGGVEDTRNSNGGQLPSKYEDTINNLSRDLINITLAVVVGILSVTTLWTTNAFVVVGDNPQKKSELKSKLLFQVLAIAFLASWSGFLGFGLKNFKIF